MKRLLLFPFVFLYNTIKKNILKTIWIVLAIIGFHFSQGYSEDVIESKTATHVIKTGKNYIYFFEAGDNRYSKMVFNRPLKNNTYVYKDTRGEYIWLQALGWVSLIVLVICFIVGISGDDTAAWEFDECFEKSLSFLIDCEFEDNKFYYFALGRLIRKSDRQVSDHYRNIANELNIHSFSDILNCPKFMTRSQRRGKLLDELV
jgi:hypothetical protein